MYLTLIILPFIGSIITGIIGRKIGVIGAIVITCTIIFFTIILTYVIFYEVSFSRSPVNFEIFN